MSSVVRHKILKEWPLLIKAWPMEVRSKPGLCSGCFYGQVTRGQVCSGHFVSVNYGGEKQSWKNPVTLFMVLNCIGRVQNFLTVLIHYFVSLLFQDREPRGPPKTASWVPTGCSSSTSFPPTVAHHGSDAHAHACTELAANAAVGIQGANS